jgi:hypothetical protein
MKRLTYHAQDYDGSRPEFYRSFRPARRRTVWQIILSVLTNL